MSQMTNQIRHLTADDGNIRLEIVDALAGQRAMFAANTDEMRWKIARERVAEPLRPWWEVMRQSPWSPMKPDEDDPVEWAMWLRIAPLDSDPGEALAALDRFAEARSLDDCADALVRTFDALAPTERGISLPTIRYALALASSAVRQERDGNVSYIGFGGNPGQIMMLAIPTEYNLPRLAAMAAHEAHHNVRLTFEPWDPETITVGQYLVIEGLGEAFSASLYGEDALGPWTRMHTEEALVAQRPVFRAVMEQGGDPRPYMFGDWAAADFHYEAKGLPDYIGYGMGYRIVRSFLEATGTSAVDATYLPWREITNGSPWLWKE